MKRSGMKNLTTRKEILSLHGACPERGEILPLHFAQGFGSLAPNDKEQGILDFAFEHQRRSPLTPVTSAYIIHD
jgi:hypothetical protein